MNKVLLVDIGNTRLKWALLEDDHKINHNLFPWQPETLEDLLDQQWRQFEAPHSVYISNVAGDAVSHVLNGWCQGNWHLEPVYAEVEDVSCGVRNSYSEPGKLGVDRWLAMIAAWNLIGQQVCVIDCGSAVTIDIVAADGQHHGGIIAPGLSLLGRVLTEHTHALNVKHQTNFPLFATNTEEAISSGCYHLFTGGINHILTKVQQTYGPQMEYIITGGDAELVKDAIDIDMTYKPDLILQGLMLSFVTSD